MHRKTELTAPFQLVLFLAGIAVGLLIAMIVLWLQAKIGGPIIIK